MPALPENPQSPEFKAATEAVDNFATMPDDQDALKLYSLYKFGRHGKNPNSSGGFSIDIRASIKTRAKRAAWDKVANSGITFEQAQAEYVEFYGKIRSKYE